MQFWVTTGSARKSEVIKCDKCGSHLFDRDESCSVCDQLNVAGTGRPIGPAQAPDESWQSVGMVTDSLKVEMARDSLDVANIPSVVLTGEFGMMLPSRRGRKASNPDAHSVLVPREYLQEARIVLRTVFGKALIDP